MQTHENETQLGNYVLRAKSVFVRQSSDLYKKATACYPSLKTTTTRGVIVGFFDLKHMSVNHYPVPLSAADTISSAGPSLPPTPKEVVTN